MRDHDKFVDVYVHSLGVEKDSKRYWVLVSTANIASHPLILCIKLCRQSVSTNGFNYFTIKTFKGKKYENIFLKSVLLFLLDILMSSFPNTKEVSLRQKQNNQI